MMTQFGFKALLGATILALGLSAPVHAAGDAKAPTAMEWSFDGLFGTYDRDTLRRGFQVYKEVCACLLYTSPSPRDS